MIQSIQPRTQKDSIVASYVNKKGYFLESLHIWARENNTSSCFFQLVKLDDYFKESKPALCSKKLLKARTWSYHCIQYKFSPVPDTHRADAKKVQTNRKHNKQSGTLKSTQIWESVLSMSEKEINRCFIGFGCRRERS